MKHNWLPMFIVFNMILIVEPTEYCQFESFIAECKDDEVIIMEYALYGRMELGRCVTADLGYVGCTADVLHLIDHRCSGRQKCDIFIPDKAFDETQPCLTELKFYLDASYSCMQVVSVDTLSCSSCNYGIILKEPYGVLPSVAASNLGCGSPDCPWIIEVSPGQRINLTLFDFSITMKYQSNMAEAGCRVYATVRDPNTGRSSTICGGSDKTKRTKHVGTSTSNKIEIRMVGLDSRDANKNSHFLLSYEAVGCANPQVPLGGWLHRDSDTITSGCNNTQKVTTIVCEGNRWSGILQNCTLETSGVFASNVWRGMNFSSGFSILVILTISIALGILIFGIGLIFLRRRHHRQPPNELHRFSSPDMHLGVDAFGKPIYQSQYSQNKLNMNNQFVTINDKNRYIRDCLQDSSDRNEYAHIWQMPLPEPQNIQSFPRNESNNNGDLTPYEDYTPSIPSENYESIPAGGLLNYGNNTTARNGNNLPCPFDVEFCDDPRYYQLDPNMQHSQR